MVTKRHSKSFRLRRKKFQNLLRRLTPLKFWSAFRHFGARSAESFGKSKSSWMMDPTRSREMPSYSAIDLAEIRSSSKISSWILSIISWAVTVWFVQDEEHNRWKNHHVSTGPPRFSRWHTMVYVLLMFLPEWGEFPSLPCLAGRKTLDDRSRLHVAEMARVSWHVPFQPISQEDTCNSHMNRSPFPTTLSIPFYDIWNYVGLRTYQHTVVLHFHCKNICTKMP